MKTRIFGHKVFDVHQETGPVHFAVTDPGFETPL